MMKFRKFWTEKRSSSFQNELKTLEKLAKPCSINDSGRAPSILKHLNPNLFWMKRVSPVDVIVKERLFAHKLIEECMLWQTKLWPSMWIRSEKAKG
jgi:ribonuclease R